MFRHYIPLLSLNFLVSMLCLILQQSLEENISLPIFVFRKSVLQVYTEVRKKFIKLFNLSHRSQYRLINDDEALIHLELTDELSNQTLISSFFQRFQVKLFLIPSKLYAYLL